MESNFIIISSSHFETGVEWQKQKPFSFSSIFPRLNLVNLDLVKYSI